MKLKYIFTTLFTALSLSSAFAGNYTHSRLDDATRTSQFYNIARSMSGVSVYFDMRCGAKYGYMGSIISPRLGNFHVFDYSYYNMKTNQSTFGYNSPIRIDYTSLGIMTFEDHYCDAVNSKMLMPQPNP